MGRGRWKVEVQGKEGPGRQLAMAGLAPGAADPPGLSQSPAAAKVLSAALLFVQPHHPTITPTHDPHHRSLHPHTHTTSHTFSPGMSCWSRCPLGWVAAR